MLKYNESTRFPQIRTAHFYSHSLKSLNLFLKKGLRDQILIHSANFIVFCTILAMYMLMPSFTIEIVEKLSN
jgi:hypothetical protein